jgi:2-iminobutanoate/2-iminopropanoate deaminase
VTATFLSNQNTKLPFASAALVGDLVLMSGEIGVTADGRLAGDLRAQARQALENIEATLKRIGCAKRDIVKCTIMLRDMRRWDEFNVEYRAFFGELDLPARSAFGVASLALDAELEIECVALRRNP